MEGLQVSNNNPLLKPNITEVVKNEVFNAVMVSIAQCYAHLNTKVPPEDELSYLTNEVTDNIIEKYPQLRTSEINIAFANGIRKQYGDFYGLCVVSFEGFIAGYLASEQRAELVRQKSKLMIEQKKQPTPSEKFETGKKLCINLFERFMISGLLDRTALAVYEFLKPLNLIDKDYKSGIYSLALQETVDEKNREIVMCSDIHKRRILNTELEHLTANIEKDMLTVDQHNTVLRTGRKIILKNWFNDLILNEEDLGLLIDNANR